MAIKLAQEGFKVTHYLALLSRSICKSVLDMSLIDHIEFSVITKIVGSLDNKETVILYLLRGTFYKL